MTHADAPVGGSPGRALPEDGSADALIAMVVRGRRFADVGGLIGTEAEKLSVARRAGATGITMLDVLAPESEWWTRLRERLGRLGISGYDCLSGDMYALDVAPFDVVHSGGLLEHSPNPVAHLERLRSLAQDYVVLTSAVVPPLIWNRHGILRTPPSGTLFVPALSERQRRIYTAFHTRGDDRPRLGGINCEATYWLTNYSAWWWLFTVQAIRGLSLASAFEVVQDHPAWDGRGHTFLLRNTGRLDPPPLG